MNLQSDQAVLAQLQSLMDDFFSAVSFKPGEKPHYGKLRDLFIESGRLIRNSGTAPDVATVEEFILPRQKSVNEGELTQFHEAEIAQITEVFGKVAHRFSAYVKSGILQGGHFAARGVICTQFVQTAAGWKMSSMAWDDERPGLPLPVLGASTLVAQFAP